MKNIWWKKAFLSGTYPLAELAGTPGWRRRTRMETDFIRKALRLKRGQKLLDVCCGTGRHSLPLAKAGFRVTGVDISPAYLREARREAKKRSLKISLLQKDARKLGFRKEFDSAINLFTSFGYFSDPKDDQRMLASVHKALKPGGFFLLDTFNGAKTLQGAGGKRWNRWTQIRKELFLLEDGELLSSRVARTRWIILNAGKHKEMVSLIRMYDRPGLSRLFQRAGFKVLRAFGEMNGKPYTPDSPRLTLLAQKPR